MTTCGVCGNNLHYLDIIFKKDNVDYIQCPNCKFIFIPPYERVNVNYENYKNEKIYEEVKKQSLYLKIARNKLKLSYLKKYLPKDASILDIGSGWGHFVYTCEQLGYTAQGIEMAKDSYTYSIKELGIHAAQGNFLTFNFKGRRFDMITLWDVLEHIDLCDVVISKCYKLLKPGGYIVFHVPQLDSKIAKYYGINWQCIGLDHVNYFTTKTATHLLNRFGFKVVKIKSSIELKLWLMYWWYERKRKTHNIEHHERQAYFNSKTSKPLWVQKIYVFLHNVIYRVLSTLKIGDEMMVIAKK